MAEDLKTISAPALTTGYGQDIKDTFTDIDENFKILGNRDINKGESGTGVISLNIPFSELLKGDNDFETVEGLWFHGQRTNFTEMFKKVKKGLTGEDPEDTDADVARSIQCLETSGRSICVLFDEPAPENTSVIEIKTTIPYVFKDDSFIEEYEEHHSIEYDLSGVISYDYNFIETNPWNCKQLFPTLYYNSNPENENLYWVIDGANTTIPAQGPSGINGKDGALYVGLVNTVPTPIQGETQVIITKLLIESGWTDVSSLDSSQVPKQGSPILLLPEYANRNNNDFTSYAISTIIVNTSSTVSLTSNLTNDNILYAKMTSGEFINCMCDIINHGDNTDDRHIPGYFFRNKEGNNGYIFFRNGDQLILRKVINVNNPTNTGTSGEFNLKIDGDGSLIVGGNCSVETAVNAVATGLSTIASGNYSHAEGDNTTASGYAAHAEGINTTAEGDYSHAEGHSTASGIYSHAEGYNTETGGNYTSNTKTPGTPSEKGDFSHAEGNATIANGYCSHSEGKQTLASGNQSHAEGYSVEAIGDGSHAEGINTKAKKNYSHAEGSETIADGLCAHAEGINTKASADCAHAEGRAFNNGVIKAEGQGSHVGGYSSGSSSEISAISNGAFAHGYANTGSSGESRILAMGLGAHAEGYAEGKNIIASGAGAHAEGQGTNAGGNYSHAEGESTTAFGEASHAEGYQSTAEGDYSHVEGVGTETSNNALGAHAEGYASEGEIIAEGSGAHVEGYTEGENIVASGNGAHAEGYAKGRNIIASGNGAHAEGVGTTASKEASHAEGYKTTASGKGAHAEGYQSTAEGDYSHAEGYHSTASGGYSHAEGYQTIASGLGSHASGIYNAPGYALKNPTSNTQTHILETSSGDWNEEIIFSIGCGDSFSTTGSDHRRNAFFVTKKGFVWALKSKGNRTYGSSGGDKYICLNPN